MLARLFYLAPVTLIPLTAQSLVDADHLGAVRDAFAAADSAPGLQCQFTPVPPELNFNLRFLTGYSAKSTMNGDRWEILLRVTPEGREPVYLTSSVKLAESTGTFVVGEGAYRVDALMKNDSGRVCSAKWRIQAKLQAAERRLAVSLPTGAVTDLAAKPVRTAAAVEPKLGRLTVLLHAAPLALGRAELEPDDLLTLSGSLEALVENVPARSTRVVIFSLDQRAVIYQKDDFTADDLDQVSRRLSETKFGVVDYKTLQKTTGTLAMAEELLRAELARPNAPDALVFLGPHSREDDNPKPVKTLPGAVKLFYVQCWDLLPPVSDPTAPFGPTSREAAARQNSADPGLMAGTTTQNRRNPTMPNQPPPPRPPRPPDVIEILMKSRGGETLSVDSPNSFASAVHKILERAGAK